MLSSLLVIDLSVSAFLTVAEWLKLYLRKILSARE